MKKIRIIDADALKANMFDYAPPEMLWDRGDIEYKIDEQPTIDAIPVEWIEEKIRLMKQHCESSVVEIIQSLVYWCITEQKDWR